MGRRKVITTEELIRLIDEFCLQFSDEDLTIPALGRYIRSKGMNVKDYIIRRDQKAREYIDAIKSKNRNNHIQTVVVYHPLDVNKFMSVNRQAKDMRQALSTLDAYYASVAHSAATLIKESKAIKAENAALKKENEELKQKLKEKIERVGKREIREKDSQIHTLERLLLQDVYPAVAQSVYDNRVAEGVRPECLDNVIKGDSEISPASEFDNDFIEDLFSNFG